MGSKSIAIGLVVGAALSPGFSSTLKTAKDKARELKKELKGSQEGQRVSGDVLRLQKRQSVLLDKMGQASRAGNAILFDKLAAVHERSSVKLLKATAAAERYGVTIKNAAAKQAAFAAAVAKSEKALKPLETRLENQAKRKELGGQIMGTVGAALAVSAPIVQAVDFEHKMRATGNIADLDDTALAKAGMTMRVVARETNQTQDVLQGAWSLLLGKGMGQSQALAVLQPIGRAATATGAAIEDLSSAVFSVMDNLKVGESDVPQVMDVLAKAGKEGSFELKSMAQYFPQLTAQAQALGMKGVESAASLGAALQVAMKGAGDESEAANNMKNFMSKLTAPDTIKNFKKFGINLKKSMSDAVARGENPMEHMLGLIQKVTKGDKFKLGDLFGDQQAVSFILPMLANMEEYKRIKGEALNSKGVVDQDFQRMMSTTKEQMKSLGIAGGALALTLGQVFQPAMASATGALVVGATWVNRLTTEFPALTNVVGYAVLGLTVFKVASLGAGYGLTVVRDALLFTRNVVGFFSGGLSLASGLLGLLKSATMGTVVGQRILAAGTAIVTAAQWAWNVALSANPIGAVVAGVALLAGSAYLVVKYWEPITQWWGAAWNWCGEQLGRFVGWAGSVIEWLGEKFSWFSGKSGEASKEVAKLEQQAGKPGTVMPAAPVAPDSKAVFAELQQGVPGAALAAGATGLSPEEVMRAGTAMQGAAGAGDLESATAARVAQVQAGKPGTVMPAAPTKLAVAAPVAPVQVEAVQTKPEVGREAENERASAAGRLAEVGKEIERRKAPAPGAVLVAAPMKLAVAAPVAPVQAEAAQAKPEAGRETENGQASALGRLAEVGKAVERRKEPAPAPGAALAAAPTKLAVTAPAKPAWAEKANPTEAAQARPAAGPAAPSGQAAAPAPVAITYAPNITVSAEADTAAVERLLRKGADEIRRIVEDISARQRRLAYE